MPRRGDSRRTTQEQSLPAAPELPEPAAQPLTAAALSPLGLMLSSQRLIVWCNRRFAELFGYAREELVGQSSAMLYPSDVDHELIGDRRLLAMRQSAEYQDERLVRRPDGVVQWFRVHGRADDRADPFRLAAWVFEPLAAGASAPVRPARPAAHATPARRLQQPQTATTLPGFMMFLGSSVRLMAFIASSAAGLASSTR
jgi:PAS domain S-box-containing protein